MHQSLGEFEDQRVSGIDRRSHLYAQKEIPLCIVLVDTVDDRVASKAVARIKRDPDVVVEGVADMSLKSEQRLLPQDLLATIGGIVGEEVDVGVAVELPPQLGPKGIAQRDFRLE